MPHMATPNLDQEIQSRIQSFLAELSRLVKMAALGSVHAALGGELEPRMRRGPGRPRGSTMAKRGPGRPRKAGRPAGGGRVRRSTEDLQAIGGRVLAYVRSNAGARLEEIGRGLKTDTAILKRPVALLLEGKQIRTEGQKRGTKYFAGGRSKGAIKPARKAKPQRRRKAKGVRKAKASRPVGRKAAGRRSALVVARASAPCARPPRRSLLQLRRRPRSYRFSARSRRRVGT